MSWLSELVRPRIATRKRREVAAGVWEKCPECGHMLYQKDLDENFNVCTHCGHHLRIDIEWRIELLFDTDSATTLPLPNIPDDPLRFRDRKRYAERLRDARTETDAPDAIRVLRTRLEGIPLIAALMDFDFMAGSMGRLVGEGIVLAAQTALKERLPLLIITTSGGARMQEGILSLMQMARTTAALAALKEAGLPYIVLLTDPTTGGVTASFATLGDITIAEPGALVGFAGPRVIRQTIGETLPEGFQKAEYLLAHGMIDMVLPRAEQKATLAKLLKILLKQST